ncbi:hypothetical protein [Synechococcus sp. BA-132 BA5]|uniref:hypothetical protein n=1 Tax=Synechococcus sp. BA-132 BA5 TaxID=3110252 RepID=UPI002B211438|nr:hypothetical protein [Synechococcus sp. BA-132 BA5]MEA5415752.1 hypothetical protein [Synechococcus sp. BA-132 BA5]
MAVAEAAEPGDDGRTLVLELPLEALQEQRPRLKARWVGGGSTADFHAELDALAIRGWRVAIARYEPVRFTAWP